MIKLFKQNSELLALTITHSSYNESPRTFYEPLTTMYCLNHRHYTLGDQQLSVDELNKAYNEAIKNDDLIVYKLRAYEHSNISLSILKKYPYNDEWDSYFVGFITFDKVKHDYIKNPLEVIFNELELYNDYLSGEVYFIDFYTIKKQSLYNKEKKLIKVETIWQNNDECELIYGSELEERIKQLNGHYAFIYESEETTIPDEFLMKAKEL